MIDRKIDYPNHLFKFSSLLWRPQFVTSDRQDRHFSGIRGPYCNVCRADIGTDDPNNSKKAWCKNCDKQYELSYPITELTQKAHIAYDATLKKDFEVISLELPPDVILDKDENDKYWIEARLGQKNGKLMGVIYMGEKLENQTKKDYIQMFVDIDDQQIRFDKGNKNPLKLLSIISAEFEESKVITQKKK